MPNWKKEAGEMNRQEFLDAFRESEIDGEKVKGKWMELEEKEKKKRKEWYLSGRWKSLPAERPKGMTVLDKINAQLRSTENRRKMINAGYNRPGIRDALTNAKANRNKPMLDAIVGQRRQGLGSPKISSSKSIFRSAILEVKDNLDKKLVRLLMEIFTEGTNINQEEQTRPLTSREILLEKLLDSIEEGEEIGLKLKGDLKENDILTAGFMLRIEDSVKKGEKRIHANIIGRLVDIKYTEEGTERKPNLLYRRLESNLKRISGKAMPNRSILESTMRKFLRGDVLQAANIKNLLLSDNYHFRPSLSIKHYDLLLTKIDTLIEDWEEVTDLFFTRNEEGTGTWGADDIEIQLKEEWDSLSDEDKADLDYEDLKGNKYLERIYVLEENYYVLKQYFKAHEKLKQVFRENKDKKSFGLPEQEEWGRRRDASQKNLEHPVKSQYKKIVDSIDGYNEYRKKAIDKIKEDKNRTKEERKERIKQVEIEPKTDAEKQYEEQIAGIKEERQRTQTERVSYKEPTGKTTEDPFGRTIEEEKIRSVEGFNPEAFRAKHTEKIRQKVENTKAEIENAKEELKTANDDDKEKIQELIDNAQEVVDRAELDIRIEEKRLRRE